MYLTVQQVADRFGVHKMTIWLWARERPEFPKPVKLSARTTRWKQADIQAFEAAKNAA